MTLRHRTRFTAVLLAAVAGCGPLAAPAEKPALTERQRDSVLSRSVLPGAGVVGRALDESDRAARRSADLDSLDATLPR